MILNLMCGLLQLVACLCTLFQAIKATKDLLLLRVVMQRPLSKQKVNAEESGSVISADKHNTGYLQAILASIVCEGLKPFHSYSSSREASVLKKSQIKRVFSCKGF